MADEALVCRPQRQSRNAPQRRRRSFGSRIAPIQAARRVRRHPSECTRARRTYCRAWCLMPRSRHHGDREPFALKDLLKVYCNVISYPWRDCYVFGLSAPSILLRISASASKSRRICVPDFMRRYGSFGPNASVPVRRDSYKGQS